MRVLAMSAVATAAWVGSAMAATEGPVGTWTTEGRDSKIKIAPCGKNLCASIVWAKTAGQDENNPKEALRGRPLIGVELSRDIKPDGKGGWTASMYNPENGKTYDTTLQAQGERKLEVGGCVLGGLLCGSETWSRDIDTTASVGRRP